LATKRELRIDKKKIANPIKKRILDFVETGSIREVCSAAILIRAINTTFDRPARHITIAAYFRVCDDPVFNSPITWEPSMLKNYPGR
jgi:hypothetical protein